MDNEKLTSSSPSIVASKKSFKSILIQKLNTIRKDPKMSLVYLILGPKNLKNSTKNTPVYILISQKIH